MNDNPGVHKIELHQPKKAFAIIPNMAVRDPKLTANSFRLLAYLLSHNDGYELTYRQIEKQTGLGRYAINAASKQLAERGWLRVEQTKLKNGQFGPKSWTLLSPDANESAAGESTADGFHSGTANGLKKTKTRENKSSKKTKIEKSYSPEELEIHFNEFWEAYPLKRGKGAAAKAYEKALDKVQPDYLLDRVRSFRDDPYRPYDFTPLATTWLNQERWEDEPYKKRDKDKTNSERNIENFRASMAILRGETKEVESNEQSRSESAIDFGINLRSTEDI